VDLNSFLDDVASLASLIDERASARAGEPYVLDARGPLFLTYGDLARDVRTRSAVLEQAGVRSGDRVGLVIQNPVLFTKWFLAGLWMGVWVAPLDPTGDSSHLALTGERARVLSLGHLVTDREGLSGPHVLSADIDAADRSELADARPGGGVVLSSSGTTGTPKVMALATSQLIATATLVAHHNRLESADRGFNPLPLWHVNAEVVGLLATLVAGSSLVLDDRFHRTGFWKIIDDAQVTWINAVPAILSRLLPLESGEEVPRRVRFVRSASAPLSAQLSEHFEEETGLAVVQSYGMTEAASQICANPLEGPRKPGSVGRPVGVQVRVVGAGGPRAAGAVEIKGPTVIGAYEGEGYADRFDDEGWLRTGDLGYFDDDGYLFLVGRSDDVINRGGEKIYPLEIEQVLLNVPGVSQVAVIGEHDDVFGQVPVAFVHLQKPSDDPTSLRLVLDDLRREVNRSFVKAWRPVRLKVVASFPQHATGKIQKGPLRSGDVTVLYDEPL